MSLRRSTLCVVVLAGALASPAFGERITLGVANATKTTHDVSCSAPQCTVAQTSSPEGSFRVPADGRIVAWWAAIGGGIGSAGELRVLRRVIPLTQVRYQAVGTSASASGLAQHPTHHDTDLPVQANDLIGLTFSGLLYQAIDTGAIDEHFAGGLADGSVATPGSEGRGATDEYGAEFVFRPIVTQLSTSSGPITGGGTLTITGIHFTESTEVRFGSTPATGMSTVSNTSITVQIPPGSGTVDVTVIGPGGTSATVGTDRYTYLGRSATVSPSVVDFGHTLVGRSSGVQSVTLTNNGKIAVSVGTDTLGGANAGDFSSVSDGCGGRDVPAGGTCTVKLAFKPSAAGNRRATLRIGDNASDGPHTVVLTGSGDNPAPVSTTTTTTTTPTVPSSAFAIDNLVGTRLLVIVHARGRIRVTGRRLVASSASGGPGVVVVKLRLTATARRTLIHRHRLAVRMRITFTPRGGRPATKVRTLLLRA